MTLNDSWAIPRLTRTTRPHGKSCRICGPWRRWRQLPAEHRANPDRSVPSECKDALKPVGKWLDKYGDAIFGAEPCQTEWMITGGFTAKGNKAYYHCNRWPGKELGIGGLENKVVSARLMGGEAVSFTQKGTGW